MVTKNDAPLILSLDTATRAGSVALSRGPHVIASRRGHPEVSHSRDLLRHVAAVLEEAGVTIRDVDLFAVTGGPGSFTGLRIGIATVKSFAATLTRPCVGIPTLFAVGHAAGASARTVAMLPAGRGEVFAQLVAVDSSGDVRALEEPSHLSPQNLFERIAGMRNLKWAGEAAQTYAGMIRASAAAMNVALIEDEKEGLTARQTEGGCWELARTTSSLAGSVAALALRRFQSGDIYRPEELRADYVRPSDAEINQRC